MVEEGGMLTQRNRFFAGEILELVTRDHPPIRFVAEDMKNEEGEPIDSVPHPMQRFSMPLPIPAEPLSLIRKPKE